jgi:hypothetical protein
MQQLPWASPITRAFCVTQQGERQCVGGRGVGIWFSRVAGNGSHGPALPGPPDPLVCRHCSKMLLLWGADECTTSLYMLLLWCGTVHNITCTCPGRPEVAHTLASSERNGGSTRSHDAATLLGLRCPCMCAAMVMWCCAGVPCRVAGAPPYCAEQKHGVDVGWDFCWRAAPCTVGVQRTVVCIGR